MLSIRFFVYLYVRLYFLQILIEPLDRTTGMFLTLVQQLKVTVQ